MILTDDNFATIVRAVEYGRELYDNLSKYIRFQMAALVGFIATFLGAAIFSIADGIPFSPLAVLWINFVVQVPIAIALGFDKPLPGLMDSQTATARRARAQRARSGSEPSSSVCSWRSPPSGCATRSRAGPTRRSRRPWPSPCSRCSTWPSD